MKKTVFGLLVTGLFATSAASAQEVNNLRYDVISAGFLSASVKTRDGANSIEFDRFNGGYIAAEGLVAQRVFLGLTYSMAQSDNAKVNGRALSPAFKTDLSQGAATVGYRFSISNGIDLIPLVTHYQTQSKGQEVGAAEEKSSSRTTGVGAQLRAAISPTLELHFSAERDDEKTNTFGAAGVYKFQARWGARLGVSRGTGQNDFSNTTIILGVNYYY